MWRRPASNNVWAIVGPAVQTRLPHVSRFSRLPLLSPAVPESVSVGKNAVFAIPI